MSIQNNCNLGVFQIGNKCDFRYHCTCPHWGNFSCAFIWIASIARWVGLLRCLCSFSVKQKRSINTFGRVCRAQLHVHYIGFITPHNHIINHIIIKSPVAFVGTMILILGSVVVVLPVLVITLLQKHCFSEFMVCKFLLLSLLGSCLSKM